MVLTIMKHYLLWHDLSCSNPDITCGEFWLASIYVKNEFHYGDLFEEVSFFFDKWNLSSNHILEINKWKTFFFFFFKEFQPIVSAPDDSSLSSDQDTNQFFGVGGD